MNIPINKDLEEEYKNELIKGFSLREIVYVVISVLVVAGVSLIIWKIFEMPPDISVYIGLPFGIPTLLLGFKKIQGLTLFAYVKEIIYESRTKLLVYDADELPREEHIFEMEKSRKQERWRR